MVMTIGDKTYDFTNKEDCEAFEVDRREVRDTYTAAIVYWTMFGTGVLLLALGLGLALITAAHPVCCPFAVLLCIGAAGIEYAAWLFQETNNYWCTWYRWDCYAMVYSIIAALFSIMMAFDDQLASIFGIV